MTTNLNKIVSKLKEKHSSLRLAKDKEESKDFISTGNLSLDLALEGGVYWGYATEWSGGSGSGKTLMLQLMLAYAQKKYNAIGIWFDREKAWFNDRAVELGIDLSRVIVVEPQDISTVTEASILAEEILNAISEDEYKFIAIDSISAFAKGGKTDKADMGKKPQEIHNLFRSILPYVNLKTSLNFSNQRTFKIGVMFGNPETTTGGEGPKYYTTYRVKLDDKKAITDPKKGNEIIGNWIQATVIKTRCGPNFRKVSFPFYFREGIPFYGGIARMLADKNILKPKNEKDFNSFKQSTLKYGKEEVNEHKIEEFLSKHSEIDISIWPEWKEDSVIDKSKEKEKEKKEMKK